MEFHQVFEHLKTLLKYSATVVNILVTKGKLKKYQKGEILLHEGEICTNVYVIIKGLARSVYAMRTDDNKIKEVSTWFYDEGVFFYMANSYINGMPSEEFIELLEDSWVLTIDKHTIDYNISNNAEFYYFTVKQYEKWIVMVEKHTRSIYEQRQEQRYEYFLSAFGHLANRLRQQDIASFLRISMYDFSRLRTKMAKNKK